VVKREGQTQKMSDKFPRIYNFTLKVETSSINIGTKKILKVSEGC